MRLHKLSFLFYLWNILTTCSRDKNWNDLCELSFLKQVFRRLRKFLRTILSGWNISTSLSMPDKSSEIPFPRCNRDRSQWRFRYQGIVNVSREWWSNERIGTSSIISRLPSALAETALYYIVDFRPFLQRDPGLVTDIENTGETNNNGTLVIDNWKGCVWSFIEL